LYLPHFIHVADPINIAQNNEWVTGASLGGYNIVGSLGEAVHQMHDFLGSSKLV